jgi:hypothetical protein
MAWSRDEIINLVTAIGTAVAAIVALAIAVFQDRMRTWFMRPKLDVSIDLCPPDCHKTKMRYRHSLRGYFEGGVSLQRDPKEWPREKEVDTYYFRLRVKNSGSQKAEWVEVFAARLSKKQADGSYKSVDSFLPMNLVWSHCREVFLPAISPGTYKHCDLAHILDPRDRGRISGEDTAWPNVPPAKTVLSLDTFVQPYTRSYLLPFGTYYLTLIVAAANVKAITKTLEITLTGDWYDNEQEMLGQGIGIRLIR